MKIDNVGMGLGLPNSAGALPDDLDAGSLFSILIDSLVHSSAMVLDGTGRIVWSCPRCAAALGCADASEMVGQRLGSFAPDQWAAEREAAVALAIREHRVVMLAGIVGGQRMLTRCIPLAREGVTADRVLVVIAPVIGDEIEQLAGQPPDRNIVWSSVHDFGPLDALTSREIEVLALLGQGKRTKEIAETLCRSVSTIDGHRERIGQKLGVNDRAELISIARRAMLRVEDAEGSRVRLRPAVGSN